MHMVSPSPVYSERSLLLSAKLPPSLKDSFSHHGNVCKKWRRLLDGIYYPSPFHFNAKSGKLMQGMVLTELVANDPELLYLVATWV